MRRTARTLVLVVVCLPLLTAAKCFGGGGADDVGRSVDDLVRLVKGEDDPTLAKTLEGLNGGTSLGDDTWRVFDSGDNVASEIMTDGADLAVDFACQAFEQRQDLATVIDPRARDLLQRMYDEVNTGQVTELSITLACGVHDVAGSGL